ncbi:hypothetical protein K227x_60770 [Rubripirellula lacrimiformis]|uniref:Uncharacterized protein n=2 Tax=Rubripirellula lacrimiformis TaxID=1930273 RepID=A0A517NKP8_9BACT|nr:hypothetical protein K227x_60770 [Rubripirellula lacrimiformis]
MVLSLVLVGDFGASSAHAVDVYVSAIAGQPLGVATVEIPLARPIVGQTPPPIQAQSADGRVLYSYSEDIKIDVPRASETPVPPPGNGRLLGRLGQLIREIADPEPPVDQTVARRVRFLFVGDAPLRVQITDATATIGSYDVVPEQNPAGHQQALVGWWNGYTAATRDQINAADYPTWVEDYLIAMLARRLRMPIPAWFDATESQDDDLLSALKLVAGAEEIGRSIYRRSAVGFIDQSGRPAPEATLPLPAPPAWAPLFDDPQLADIPVEPMATRVPPECFYIRYGSFQNYTWFADLSRDYGGDISNMAMLRGFELGASKRIEQQLNLKTTELSRMLGPQVIQDQAIVGRDLFMTDGASLGVMFQAKNAFALRTSFNNDRSQLAGSDSEVTLKKVTVGGQAATLLSSADNRVRSFMVQDGDFFFVTNSRTLAERFLEVGKSKQSLGASSSFRLARQLMPLDREDTVFAYFSPEMLRGLVSPRYLIELRRRLSANAEVAMMHLARMAADHESKATGTNLVGVDDWIDGGFLPVGFGVRPDGSGAISVGDQVMDTRRGARGQFLPIADVPIDLVTPDEARWYAQIARQYETRFPTIDPIMVGVGRQPMEGVDGGDGGERIMVHAEVAPLGPEKYGKWSKYLGPPTRVAMNFAPDDIIAAQAHVASDRLGPPTHVFAAIKDSHPPNPDDFQGLLNIYRSIQGIPGYLGAWPQPGMLDRLPLGLGRGQPVAPGINRLIGGMYRYSDGQFSVLSFQPEVLQASLPHLAATEASDLAQIRAQVGNLSGSQIEGWVNAQLYSHARESSIAGASLLSLMTRQLGARPEHCLAEVQRVLGVPLQCTLGGDYQYSPATGQWISTAWRGEVAPLVAPADYVAPPMKWFRGSAATVTQYADRLVADAVIDVAR